MFCGLPGTGIHATRIFGFAFWDIVATAVAAFLIDKWFFHSKHFLATLVVLCITAVFTHKALGIDTKLNKMLFK